jgi:hypothetical protein
MSTRSLVASRDSHLFRVAVLQEAGEPDISSHSPTALTLEEAKAKAEDLNRYLPEDYVARVMFDDVDYFGKPEPALKGGDAQ